MSHVFSSPPRTSGEETAVRQRLTDLRNMAKKYVRGGWYVTLRDSSILLYLYHHLTYSDLERVLSRVLFRAYECRVHPPMFRYAKSRA